MLNLWECSRTGMSTLQGLLYIIISCTGAKYVVLHILLSWLFNGLSQVFYFIKPTPANLAAYEKWSGTEMQNHSWLGDMVDEVYKVELTTGNTMIIPTGWIHAVVGVRITEVDFAHTFFYSIRLSTHWCLVVTFCTPTIWQHVRFIPIPYIPCMLNLLCRTTSSRDRNRHTSTKEIPVSHVFQVSIES